MTPNGEVNMTLFRPTKAFSSNNVSQLSRCSNVQAVAPARVKLVDWQLADGNHPTLYTHDGDLKEFVPPITVNCDVMTPYGRGRVLEVGVGGGQTKVILTEWR